ncbi:MAG: RAMP superfamily CRISPR-associated protein, partial [Candidatus Methanoperedens sp.]|nr:RAMP superfamily CRISPR-associated protein [Candidatus Methanoperedens sp.]
MNILKISFLSKNALHTTGESKGSLVDFLRNSKDEPYIPATHIKGIMRTEAERLLRSIENIPCYITGNPKIILCDEVKAGGFRCDVCRVFGVPNTEGGGDYREGKIRITDFRKKNKVIAVSRMHVSIMRETQTKQESALFNMHSVPSETEFSGFVIIREALTDSEDKLL